MTRPVLLALVLAAASSGGCASLTNPVADAVPVRRVPAELLGRPKADLRPVPLTMLRQRETDQYRLDKGDVLAVVAGDLFGPVNQAPPVRLPDQVNQTGATGYPVPVNDNGTITLPLLPAPLDVRGKTIPEVEKLVRDAVTGQLPGFPKQLFPPGAARVTVQLLQKRRYQITVVREDTVQMPFTGMLNAPIYGGSKKGAGFNISLPAGENDVLHALNATGGPPGLDARNEIIILRGQYDPSDPATQATRIPLRIYPDQQLVIPEESIVLHDGDIIRIEARETEVYYTAGLVGGGQYPLPRDYDLDVIEALAQVRAPLINGSFNQNAFVGAAVQAGIGFPNPSLCVVLRQLPNRQQLPIRVDLNRAFRDPRERILIQPGDVIVLQERPGEAIARYLTTTIRFNTVAESIKAPGLQQTITGNNP